MRHPVYRCNLAGMYMVFRLPISVNHIRILLSIDPIPRTRAATPAVSHHYLLIYVRHSPLNVYIAVQLSYFI